MFIVNFDTFLFCKLEIQIDSPRIQVLSLYLQDLMNKVRSDTLLDMSIEKSRVKEMVSSMSNGKEQ